MVVLKEGEGKGFTQRADRILQHLRQFIRCRAGTAGQGEARIKTGADLVPSGQGFAQPQLRRFHIGATGQQISGNADRQFRNGLGCQRSRCILQLSVAAAKQQAQGITGLLLLRLERGELSLFARLLLAGLCQIESGDGSGLVFGLGQLFGASQVGQLLLAQGNGRGEIAKLPILLKAIADQQQTGAGKILLAGSSFPACLIPRRCQLAPQIHFIAQAK